MYIYEFEIHRSPREIGVETLKVTMTGSWLNSELGSRDISNIGGEGERFFFLLLLEETDTVRYRSSTLPVGTRE